MAVPYQPINGSIPSGSLATAWLSQRDLALNIPINYVTHASVSLQPACFASNQYLFAPAVQCISNLLAVGFQRLTLDLYWDSTSQHWSLCPVQLGPGASSTTGSSSTQTTTAEITSVQTQSRSSTETGSLVLRQAESSVDASSTPINSPTSTGPPAASGVVQNGDFTCSTNLTFSVVNQLFMSYFVETSNNVNASLRFMILNLHVAAATGQQAVAGGADAERAALPDGGNSISQLLNSTLSTYLYTPLSLQSQRADIGATWYGGSNHPPVSSYFDIEGSDGASPMSTRDGWPGEGFIELDRENRLVVGFGVIDEGLADYDTTIDQETIFAEDQLSSVSNVTVEGAGNVTRGCFASFPPADSVAAANNSFATSSTPFQDPMPSQSLNTAWTDVRGLVACGISPLLNTTLSDTTADVDADIYGQFASSTIWSWMPGQPNDDDNDQVFSSDPSSASSQESDRGDSTHCAAINMSHPGPAKWQVADCSNSHYGLCRIGSTNPYAWTLTGQKGIYGSVADACPEDSTFAVPRTSLENSFATRYISARLNNAIDDQPSLDLDGSRLFWVNLNDLDVEGCWVAGENSTCPYRRGDRFDETNVAVPTVAGVVVFAIAALTVLVKCAGNRKSSRRRKKRGEAHWEYEGIPS